MKRHQDMIITTWNEITGLLGSDSPIFLYVASYYFLLRSSYYQVALKIEHNHTFLGTESFLSITGLKKIIQNSLVIREMLHLKLFFFSINVEKASEANPFSLVKEHRLFDIMYVHRLRGRMHAYFISTRHICVSYDHIILPARWG